ncbi:MAG TPA: LuxR family transcriptional regulator [Mycobacterium sp.]|uniref:LuxR family transcriptional regulator n=1 Tax=Mycobacterium sp. TaxID=1785 RepID=UPI002C5B47F4|nr:LuxR family transcriptional regulator [Mycobacterium sp.]HME75091.1 LuxR family transcriptional regulator [Mycobacterium sp.]
MGDRHRAADASTSLCGRRRECAALDGLLARVRGGRSGVLVLRGEAGIGKSALLGYLTEQAAGFGVARCMGVESEMELAFTGLHDLCKPMLSCLDALVEPQREALSAALGLASGEPPESFLVALAALNLLAQAAEERPLLCIVDDVQWLDQATAQVLGFVGRRLLAEPVGLVFAARTTAASEDPLAGLPDLRLSGLDEQSARALLASVTTARLDESVRRRILEEAHGNPLALRELGVVDFAGGFAMPDSGSVPRRIEDQYLTRLRGLPRGTQRLVLVAAADPVGDPALLARAAHALDLDVGALELAVDAGLLDIGAGVRFRHPLLRSAVYRAAEVDEQRAAHAALAEATDPQLDPDRRAWHRASAAGAADEELAAELIGSADRAARRGGVAAAAAFWERAVALTPDPGRRAARALVAAEAKYAAGDFAATGKLLAAADIGALDEHGHARVELMRARIAFKLNRGADAPSLLLHAAQRLQPLDAELARQTLLEALLAAIYVGRLADGCGLAEVARGAKSVPLDPEPLPHPHMLVRGLAVRALDGYVAAAPLLKDALRQYLAQPRELDVLCHPYCVVAAELWDEEAWFDIANGQVQLARSSGTLSRLVEALNGLAVFSIHVGELAQAEALISEEKNIQLGITEPLTSYAAVLLAAWRGDAPRTADFIDQMIVSASSRGEGMALTFVEYAQAVLYNGLADYELAAVAAHSASSDDRLLIPHWPLPELVEAAMRSGQPARAAAACERLSAMAAASGTDSARGAAALARALVADGDMAEDLYREAIELLSHTRMASHLARARLCYGEWLRCNNRRAEASTQLRAAFDAFSAMGANAFADRARRELDASGEQVRSRRDLPSAEFTPQEHQIVQLARTRRTNPEIGAELFLSARTVEWHLRNIFTKLGISSRHELDAALTRRDHPLAVATGDR